MADGLKISRSNKGHLNVSNVLLHKTIKKRVRNRYGNDTSQLGFVKHYVVNNKTGRAN